MKNYFLIPAIPVMFLISSCGSNASSNDAASNTATKASIIPASTHDVNEELAAQGKTIFNSKCTSCHQMDMRVVGPPMKGVTQKRSQEWLVDMIHKPEEMTKNDPIAKELLKEYNGIQMTSMASREEAEAIVEFLKLNDR